MRKKFLALALVLLVLGGCTRVKTGEKDTGQAVDTEAAPQSEEPVIGLILTSEDAGENEEIISRFREEAEAAGARLEVRIPEVAEKDAREAAALTEHFVLCQDVLPDTVHSVPEE